MSDEELEVGSSESGDEGGGEESAGVSGGPGESGESFGEPSSREIEEEPEREHREVRRTEKVSRPSPAPSPAPVLPGPREPLWKKEKVEYEARKKTIPLPADRSDASQVDAYNSALTDLYFEVHQKYSALAADERAAQRTQNDRVWNWIETESQKYGIDNTEFEVATGNPAQPTMRASLKNIFLSVATNPGAFGINIFRPDGKGALPLGEQVKVISSAITNFLEGYHAYRLRQGRRSEAERNNLSVMRGGGSRGPRRSESEEEAGSSFSSELERMRRNRKRVGDLRRRGD